MGVAMETSCSGGGLGYRVLRQAFPLAGGEFEYAAGRMRRDPLDDLAQISERIDPEVLTRLHQ